MSYSRGNVALLENYATEETDPTNSAFSSPNKNTQIDATAVRDILNIENDQCSFDLDKNKQDNSFDSINVNNSANITINALLNKNSSSLSLRDSNITESKVMLNEPEISPSQNKAERKYDASCDINYKSIQVVLAKTDIQFPDISPKDVEGKGFLKIEEPPAPYSITSDDKFIGNLCLNDFLPDITCRMDHFTDISKENNKETKLLSNKGESEPMRMLANEKTTIGSTTINDKKNPKPNFFNEIQELPELGIIIMDESETMHCSRVLVTSLNNEDSINPYISSNKMEVNISHLDVDLTPSAKGTPSTIKDEICDIADIQEIEYYTNSAKNSDFEEMSSSISDPTPPDMYYNGASTCDVPDSITCEKEYNIPNIDGDLQGRTGSPPDMYQSGTTFHDYVPNNITCNKNELPNFLSDLIEGMNLPVDMYRKGAAICDFVPDSINNCNEDNIPNILDLTGGGIHEGTLPLKNSCCNIESVCDDYSLDGNEGKRLLVNYLGSTEETSYVMFIDDINCAGTNDRDIVNESPEDSLCCNKTTLRSCSPNNVEVVRRVLTEVKSQNNNTLNKGAFGEVSDVPWVDGIQANETCGVNLEEMHARQSTSANAQYASAHIKKCIGDDNSVTWNFNTEVNRDSNKIPEISEQTHDKSPNENNAFGRCSFPINSGVVDVLDHSANRVISLDQDRDGDMINQLSSQPDSENNSSLVHSIENIKHVDSLKESFVDNNNLPTADGFPFFIEYVSDSCTLGNLKITANVTGNSNSAEDKAVKIFSSSIIPVDVTVVTVGPLDKNITTGTEIHVSSSSNKGEVLTTSTSDDKPVDDALTNNDIVNVHVVSNLGQSGKKMMTYVFNKTTTELDVINSSPVIKNYSGCELGVQTEFRNTISPTYPTDTVDNECVNNIFKSLKDNGHLNNQIVIQSDTDGAKDLVLVTDTVENFNGVLKLLYTCELPQENDSVHVDSDYLKVNSKDSEMRVEFQNNVLSTEGTFLKSVPISPEGLPGSFSSELLYEHSYCCVSHSKTGEQFSSPPEFSENLKSGISAAEKLLDEDLLPLNLCACGEIDINHECNEVDIAIANAIKDFESLSIDEDLLSSNLCDCGEIDIDHDCSEVDIEVENGFTDFESSSVDCSVQTASIVSEKGSQTDSIPSTPFGDNWSYIEECHQTCSFKRRLSFSDCVSDLLPKKLHMEDIETNNEMEENCAPQDTKSYTTLKRMSPFSVDLFESYKRVKLGLEANKTFPKHEDPYEINSMCSISSIQVDNNDVYNFIDDDNSEFRLKSEKPFLYNQEKFDSTPLGDSSSTMISEVDQFLPETSSDTSPVTTG